MSFRYENYGTADLLLTAGTTVEVSSDVSIFESAFQQTQSEKCFDIPATYELWCKFDIYWGGNTSNFRWYAVNTNSNGRDTGVQRSIFARNYIRNLSGTLETVNNVITANTRHTVLIHMKADSTEGIIEYFVDGVDVAHTSLRQINNGEAFDGFYLQGASDIYFSNVIISDEEISFDENAHKPGEDIDVVLTNDTARIIAKTTSIFGDTSREICKTENILSDTERNISKSINFFADTKRVLTKDISDFSDTERKIEKTFEINFDSERNIEKSEIVFSDTERNISKTISTLSDTLREITGDALTIYSDTERKILKSISLLNDTERILQVEVKNISDTERNLFRSEEILNSTCRNISKTISTFSDTERVIEKGEVFSVVTFSDTERKISVETETLADTKRILIVPVELLCDTDKTVNKFVEISNDTARLIPTRIIETQSGDTPIVNTVGGLKSFTLNLQEQSLTDSLTFTRANSFVNIGEAIHGKYFDYVFKFAVTETQQQGIVQTCKCQSDIDELLYTSIKYDITAKSFSEPEEEYKTAYEHIKKIADIVGKNLIFNATNFKSSMATEQQNVTYQSLISNLFGWTSRLPQMMINCYLRGDDLVVMQRGREPNTVDITNTRHTLPTITRTIERITWSGEPDSTATVTKKIWVWDAGSRKKDKGHDNSDYSYDADGYVVMHTTELPKGGKTKTNYLYEDNPNGGRRVWKEIEVEYDESGELVGTKEIYHDVLGQGQRVSNTYQDGEWVGSTVGNTSGQDSYEYLPDEVKSESSGHEETETKTVTIEGNPLIDTSLPIADREVLAKVSAALRELNRSIREVVSMEIYNFEHIIDFSDKIIFDGNTYSLQSNQVEKSERIINKQTISIVRWFK